MTGSPQTASPRRAWILAVLTTVLAGLLIPTVTGAASATWDSKVSTTTYNLDRQRDSIRNAARDEILLDILCSPTIQPQHRRCR